MKIRAENLFHHFRIKPVLKNVSFSISEGELVAIMGPNGMGKSTILKSLTGMLTPVRGKIYIDEIARGQTREKERALRKKIAWLPDHPWLPSGRTGRELLFAMGDVYEVTHERIFAHVERLLELFELREKADSPISSYSNGQKKKIAIAAVLITDAPILILDEPFTGGLDPSGIHALKQVLRHLGERSDVTVVMASQIPEIVEAIAQRVLVIADGELIADGSPSDLQREFGVEGQGLGGALENLINPNTALRVAHYFA